MKTRLFFRPRAGPFGSWASLFIFFGIVISLASGAFGQVASISGTVTKVRDGDTIEVGPIAIRLMGVAAPELGEPLGSRARDFMFRVVFSKPIQCELNGDKSYDRFVALCFLEGKDIGAAVISAGLALDCPRFSGGRYRSLERAEALNKIKLPRYCLGN
ncbi:MAG TPA: nuclease [Rhodospirillaceae bacterium]|nr:nuclease [Rhodospirillaceae bacterium]